MKLKHVANLVKRIARFISNKVIGERKIKTTYLGSDFYYPNGSAIGEMIRLGGIWDKKIIDYIRQHSDRKVNLIVEVGSNIGASSIYMSKVFDEAFIVMIEGSSRYRSYLETNVQLANVNGDIKSVLVSGHSGKEFTLKTDSTTGTPSNPHYSLDTTSTETLISLTLDELLQEANKGKVDVLKIDTDGFEEEVLTGASTVFYSNPIVFLEFSPNSLRRITVPENVISLLSKYGYSDFRVFSPNGDYLGLAQNYDEIMKIKDAYYYVDLLAGI